MIKGEEGPSRASAIYAVDRYCAQEADIDTDGGLAVRAGAQCYRAAMECQDGSLRDVRVALFQAAEYLYRIAAGKGNLWGFVDLGYIYYYDRCEGAYYPDFRQEPDEAARAYCDAFPLDQRAYENYLHAADLGEAQSCYKVGDLLKHGRGCERDERAAFERYQQAYRLSDRSDAVAWGSAALRLGDCFEQGIGVDVDFAEALPWYERAEQGLGLAVESGSWYFKKSLASAKAGALRCRQELSGEY